MNVSKIGTPMYSPPELVRRLPFDFKVDIWALGCLLYYMACLSPPFIVLKEEDHVAKYEKLRKQRMANLSPSASSLSKQVSSAVAQAVLGKSPFRANQQVSTLTRR